ncbi:MAG TPA: SMI1/KNR4 family protein [Acidimicrobiales bacterium]|nr:SMI1/KNR4 family protein [Acidimicrobiales bacterium]
MRDWRPEIVHLVGIKQAIDDADTRGLWEYHLPKVRVSDEEIDAVERHLGIRLDPDYRAFLRYANGWPSFFQSVDLFGTHDLYGSPTFELAQQVLEVIEPIVYEQAGLEPGKVLPVAATAEDMDMFVMPVVDGQQVPPVVWIAGGEIDRFPTFDDYVLAMIEYNARELATLRNG